MKAAKPTDMARRITFPASIPAISTAIQYHGEGGARLCLDIADKDKGEFAPVAFYMLNKRLRVTLEVVD